MLLLSDNQYANGIDCPIGRLYSQGWRRRRGVVVGCSYRTRSSPITTVSNLRDYIHSYFYRWGAAGDEGPADPLIAPHSMNGQK
jgi:hypothetical protein